MIRLCMCMFWVMFIVFMFILILIFGTVGCVNQRLSLVDIGIVSILYCVTRESLCGAFPLKDLPSFVICMSLSSFFVF